MQVSWRTLRLKHQFEPEELRTIQPDKHEWIRRGQLTLHDLPDMLVFPINPYDDMGADLGEVWSMQWSGDLLAKMNVTYEQMTRHGLTLDLMKVINKPLSFWQALQLSSAHAQDMREDVVEDVFGLTKPELITILQSTQHAPSMQ